MLNNLNINIFIRLVGYVMKSNIFHVRGLSCHETEQRFDGCSSIRKNKSRNSSNSSLDCSNINKKYERLEFTVAL